MISFVCGIFVSEEDHDNSKCNNIYFYRLRVEGLI